MIVWPNLVPVDHLSCHIQILLNAAPKDRGHKLATATMTDAPERNPTRLRATLHTPDSLRSEGPQVANKVPENMCRQNLDSYISSVHSHNLICQLQLLFDLVKHGRQLLVRTDQPATFKVLCRMGEPDTPVISAQALGQCRNQTFNFAGMRILPCLLIELDRKLGNRLDVQGLAGYFGRVEKWRQ